jgi:hypothetical protein
MRDRQAGVISASSRLSSQDPCYDSPHVPIVLVRKTHSAPPGALTAECELHSSDGYRLFLESIAVTVVVIVNVDVDVDVDCDGFEIKHESTRAVGDTRGSRQRRGRPHRQLICQ